MSLAQGTEAAGSTWRIQLAGTGLLQAANAQTQNSASHAP